MVQPQLAPGQHLEQFVQRAGAARQDHHRVGIHEHHLLALMHGFGDDIAGQVGLADLPVDQVLGNHAEGVGAAGLRRPRGFPHQPDIPGAIHQPPALVGQRFSKVAGSLRVGGQGARA